MLEKWAIRILVVAATAVALAMLGVVFGICLIIILSFFNGGAYV